MIELEANWVSLALLLFSLPLVFFKLFKPKYSKNYPPGPPGLPILGHLHLLKEPTHKSLCALSTKYGPIMSLRLGSRRVVVVTSPSAVEECFTKHDITFASRPRVLVNKHLFFNFTSMPVTPYGPHFQALRRFMAQEMLSTTCLDITASLRQDEVKLTMSQLATTCFKNVSSKVDLKAKVTEITINMISLMTFGKRFYGGDYVAKAKEAAIFKTLLTDFLDLVKLQDLSDSLPIFEWMDLQGAKRKMIAAMKRMDTFLNDQIAESRENISTSIIEDSSNMPMVDKLMLLQDLEPEFYTDQTVKGLITTMLILATEASFATTEWAMALLLNHPGAMRKVRDEIDVHVGHNRLLEEGDLRNLTYLQNVISETLRLFPPDPVLIPHEATNDCNIGHYDVAQGTILFVNAWAIHRDPKLWSDPEKFIPERHEGRSGSGYDLIPFGTGRRGCAGAGLANRMVGLVIGCLIQSFDWKRASAEEVNLTASVGFIVQKLKPLEAICQPRANMVRHYS